MARIPALLAALLGIVACSGRAAERPNVVLVVIDTARADHFTSYGYPRATTPHFAALAREAILFERARSTSTWTLPAHASLFTGLLPVTHGATQENLYLDGELDTLAEILARRGYRTAAFSNNPWISRRSNLAQGFGTVGAMWRNPARREGDGLPHPTNEAVFAWLDGTEESFFLFVNYMEPHWPFRSAAAYRERFAGELPQRLRRRAAMPAVRWYLHPEALSPRLLALRRSLYDAALAHADAALGELLAGLRQRGLFDASLLVVTSDHGENLGDHDHMGHSFALYESTVRIPLAIRPPGGTGAGSVRDDPVQLPDVFATIVAAAGAASERGEDPAGPPAAGGDPLVVGRDLLAGPIDPARPIVAEYYYPELFLARFPQGPQAQATLAPYRRRLRAIERGDTKLIWGSDGRHELYDLAADPGEQRDLLATDAARAASLRADLEALVASLHREVPEAPPMEDLLDPDTRDALTALGYLD